MSPFVFRVLLTNITIVLFFAACSQEELVDVNELSVPNSFTYSTTMQISVDVDIENSEGSPFEGLKVVFLSSEK